MIWKSDEAGVTIAVESVDLAVNYGSSFNAIRARTRGFYRIENLPNRGQVKQCRCTFYQNLDAGGIVPTSVMNLKLPYALSVVHSAIEEFKEDDKIDEADRAELATLMREKSEDQVYSEEVRSKISPMTPPLQLASLVAIALRDSDTHCQYFSA